MEKAPWPGLEPGSRYIILCNVGRATAAYTIPALKEDSLHVTGLYYQGTYS